MEMRKRAIQGDRSRMITRHKHLFIMQMIIFSTTNQ